MMTWLLSDYDLSYYFLARPINSPFVLERKSLIFLLSTSSFYLIIFYVFTGYLAKDCFWGCTFAFDDFRKELFLVDGSVGS